MDVLPQTCAAYSVGTANQLFTMLLQTMLAGQCSLSAPDQWPKDYGPKALKYGLEKYDFIIIGAGTAGCVVANRLSENQNWKILLLEAGSDPPIESTIPMLFFSTINTTCCDWKYYAEKSKRFSTGLEYGVPFSRGRMLGGSGSMNAMFYVRGNRRDYDEWEALGNPLWGYNVALQYFKKSEDMLDEKILESYGGYYHNTGGPMSIDRFRNANPYKQLIMAGLEEIGDKKLLDFNGPEQIGTAEATGFIGYGERQGTARSFLAAVKDRPNLHVAKNAVVTSLQTSKRGKITGVNFRLRDSYDLTAVARNEYILSAGSIGSPQILMLSGIGPAHHLQNTGIPLFRNLPVGEHLEDHIFSMMFFEIPNATPYNEAFTLISYLQYLIDRTGIFSSSFTSDLITFFNSTNKFDLAPDLEIHHGIVDAGNKQPLALFLSGIGYKPEYIQQILVKLDTSAIVVLAVTLLRPQSRGKILLRNTDPFEHPRILANYLDHPEDIETILRGIRRGQKLLKTNSFKQLGVKQIPIQIRDCPYEAFNSDEYWRCYIRYTVTTLYHPVGTCRMGPEYDHEAVVDARLKVHGIKNLRVVDSSIMPVITRGNTYTPTVMIGEKASDMLKEDWHYPISE